MSVSMTEGRPVIAPRGTVMRLLVTRQDGPNRQYRPIGFLSNDFGEYRFAYLRSVADDPTFRPLPGLSDITRVHRSSVLFPLFAERVMSPRRADHPYVMQALALPQAAGPFEVLARSGGRRVGDTVELLPVPDVQDDGSMSVDYFVHGVRHMTVEAQDRIVELEQDDELRLLREPDNDVDPRAVLVTDSDSLHLGYVPGPLLDLIEALDHPRTTVLRANGPDVGFHFRLLARTGGVCGIGCNPFADPQWATVE